MKKLFILCHFSCEILFEFIKRRKKRNKKHILCFYEDAAAIVITEYPDD